MSSVLQIWHQECTSQKKQDDTLCVIVRTPVPYCQIKKIISPFATFLSETEGSSQKIHGACIVLTLLSKLLSGDDPWLRQKLGVSVLINTEPVVRIV